MEDFRMPNIFEYAQTKINYSAFQALWIPGTAKFVSLGSTSKTDGILQVYEINNGKPELLNESIHEKASFKCGTFGASSFSNKHLATGDFHGNLNIWDLESCNKDPIYSVKGHQSIVFGIDGVAGKSSGVGAPELVTGSKDGSVKVWDPRQKDKPVVVMQCSDEIVRECWAVAFGNSYNSQERAVCAGFDNGDIKLFDLRAMKIRWETNLPNGVCYLQFDKQDAEMEKFIATCLEGEFSVFVTKNKYNNKFPRIGEKAHHSTIWCGKHLPQNRDVFMTCGGSGSINLWKYNNENSNEIGTLKLVQDYKMSDQSIIGFDWCPDKIGLAVCTSFDQIIRLLVVTKLNMYSRIE